MAQESPPATDVKIDIKPEEKPVENMDDQIPNLEEQLEDYKKNPAPNPTNVPKPLTGLQKFELGIKYFSLSFASAYVWSFFSTRDTEEEKKEGD